MKFPVSLTLITYMATYVKLPPCAGALTNICRGCRKPELWLLMLLNPTQRVQAISPALVFKPGQQTGTVTGIFASLEHAIRRYVLHPIDWVCKKLQQCPMVWNTFHPTGDYHA